jgi:hypothetical protein
VRLRNQSNGEIKLYDHEAQKVASILKKSRNPNLFDGHTNKGRRRTETVHNRITSVLLHFFLKVSRKPLL